ncbi:uncharacterized protein LOC105029934 [Esox lucius]|uniref:uncharacterized protein LOC105029934 n=1 Tax=Esox lucius TaxID=8010 RepID=UPI0014776B89|nr:uncharacterized protein LOC105029934 [Esox lucius]XP_010901833.2 uncharacterized protein LOC105029934 [Esox lucius]XP_010901842.2 uncharacterized protein LOC105029934 [Esox lucius]XP_019901238.2 uncharacterized protein LOC105029934 [Esox lucius]XP_019901239.2 uncharacterized protein LOC105029934 [Esox lucius]
MHLFMLLSALLSIPVSLGWNEDFQIVCSGREFRLPVYSGSRIVTFTPSHPTGPRRVLLENNNLKDPRFEWTKDRTLLLKEVNRSDQGLYSIKLSSGFTYETVRLTVSECVETFRRGYGESFRHIIPEDGSLLQFSPRNAPPGSLPVVLWNRTDPETSELGRGGLGSDGRVWVAERVTQTDQGNYTILDDNGKVISRSQLTVNGHTFNVTRFFKESLNLPLFLPVPHVHLIFTPSLRSADPSSVPLDSRFSHTPVQLIRAGQVVGQDPRYWGLISLERNGTVNEVVITRLSAKHEGMYEIRDQDGNLVSSTLLHVVDKTARWRTVLKSISVPSGMFVTLAGFILFMKRYPNCSLSMIINGLRGHHTLAANPPRVNVQDYSQPNPSPSSFYGDSQQIGIPKTWSPSPAISGYTPVVDRVPFVVGLGPKPCTVPVPTQRQQESERVEASSSHTLSKEEPVDSEISFSVDGASNCLLSSDDCHQFQIKKEADKGRGSKEYFSTLPLDTDTSETCSVYTSEKLTFL